MAKDACTHAIREPWRQKRNPTSRAGLKQAGLEAVRVRFRGAGCMYKDQGQVKFHEKAKTKIEEGSVIIAGVTDCDEAATLLYCVGTLRIPGSGV